MSPIMRTGQCSSHQLIYIYYNNTKIPKNSHLKKLYKYYIVIARSSNTNNI